MKMRIFTFALCVSLAPLMASAGDYQRKNYLESYERAYERQNLQHISPSSGTDTAASPPRVENSSFDEYSLYEWTKKKEANAEPPSKEQTEAWAAIKKFNADMEEIERRNQLRRIENAINDNTWELQNTAWELQNSTWELQRSRYYGND